MPKTITREEFVEAARIMFGDDRVERQEHTIQPCQCGSPACAGWKIDPGEETDPLFVFNPPIMEV